MLKALFQKSWENFTRYDSNIEHNLQLSMTQNLGFLRFNELNWNWGGPLIFRQQHDKLFNLLRDCM